MIAQLIQKRFPSIEGYLKSSYLSQLEWQDLLIHFMSLIDFTQRKINENKEKLSEAEEKLQKIVATDFGEVIKERHEDLREYVKTEIIPSAKFSQMKSDAEKLDYKSRSKNFYSDTILDEILCAEKQFLTADYISS
jgi:hypothetical protein